MSNKTSDKNVANIEDDVKYVKEMLEIARIFFKAVKAETDYKNVDEIAFCNAMENILAEREQDKKRIQELEEENNEMKNIFRIQASIAKELDFEEQDKMIKFRNTYYVTDTMAVIADISKPKRIELSYVDVTELLEGENK